MRFVLLTLLFLCFASVSFARSPAVEPLVEPVFGSTATEVLPLDQVGFDFGHEQILLTRSLQPLNAQDSTFETPNFTLSTLFFLTCLMIGLFGPLGYIKSQEAEVVETPDALDFRYENADASNLIRLSEHHKVNEENDERKKAS